MIWQHKIIIKELKQVPWWFNTCAGLFVIILLAPLGYAVFHDTNQLLAVAGLPSTVPTINNMIHNFLNIPTGVLLKGPNSPSQWLGRLPYLDIASTAMLVLGVYSLRYHLLLIRAQLLVGCSLLFIILITLGGSVTSLALLPVIYLLIAGGLAFMLQQWFTVFPNNPVARTIATTLVSVLVLLISYYNISHYFIAWPQTPATRQAFGLQLSDNR